MTFARWMFGLPLAAAVVIFLVLIMSGLIRQEATIDPPRSPLNLSITPKIEPTPPETLPKSRPILDETAPQPVIPNWSKRQKVDPVEVAPPTTIDPPRGGPGGPVSVKPIIRVAPPYPEACASKGVEGVVLVQFDVTPEGNVANVKVISSPNACFNRAVIKAVSGWKYPPDYRDGRPVARYGVTERFNFQLTQ